jgi:hypothetical protein
MKKNYLIVCLVQAIIIITSSLLFSATAHSQDLTEAQKQERCQNNKNKIAELEAQVRVIDADMSQAMEPKEIENARKEMIFVRKMINSSKEPSKDDWNTIHRIAAHYNYGASKQSHSFTELENIIGKKIDKAVSLEDKRPELINKKNEIEKQLAAHRNNLLKWGCDATNISGTWSWSCCEKKYSGKFTLRVSGNKLSGSFDDVGDIDGTFSGTTLTFKRTWSAGTQNYILTLSSDGKTLDGSFTGDRNEKVGTKFSATRD